MNSDFEATREHDEVDSEVADPEEPASWQHGVERHTGTEATDADFADEYEGVDDLPFDDDESR